MHWLESQLIELDKLAKDYEQTQQLSENDIINLSAERRFKRAKFVDAVQALVNRVGKIKGIKNCAAYHDGLILAHAKQSPNIDAFGATVQESIQSAQQGAEVLGLGQIEQIVIVGKTDKVAMLSVGPLILCISSPKHVNLALVLSQIK